RPFRDLACRSFSAPRRASPPSQRGQENPMTKQKKKHPSPPPSVHANIFAEGHEPSNAPWIIPNLLRGRTLGMLAAAPNSLKTWSGLDLARACITGGTWLGHGPVAQSAVMLVMLDSTVGDSASQFRRLTQDFADNGKEQRDLIQDLIFRYKV